MQNNQIDLHGKRSDDNSAQVRRFKSECKGETEKAREGKKMRMIEGKKKERPVPKQRNVTNPRLCEGEVVNTSPGSGPAGEAVSTNKAAGDGMETHGSPRSRDGAILLLITKSCQDSVHS